MARSRVTSGTLKAVAVGDDEPVPRVAQQLAIDSGVGVGDGEVDRVQLHGEGGEHPGAQPIQIGPVMARVV